MKGHFGFYYGSVQNVMPDNEEDIGPSYDILELYV